MPLLGKKVFTLAANSPTEDTGDAPYLIPHTQERFQSKSEYKKRKDLYSQNIWTCRATGHTNLTHEEACKSEKVVMDQLASQFPKCFEKDVLDLVHHNTLSLETLVDTAWMKLHQQLIIGEKVNLKVKVAEKLIPARVIAVDTSSIDPKATPSPCNSPSSDKENSADEKEKEKSPKKWVLPKLLPYTYSIELENEAKVIHSVPGSDLQRIEKAPSKDMLRHFIRVSALRSGTNPTSPWVVNVDLVKQYKLISKFADFFLSPAKMSEAFKKAEENGKKRKLSNGTPGNATKKLKLDKTDLKSKKELGKTKAKSSTLKKRDKKTSSRDEKLTLKKKSLPKKLPTFPKKIEKSKNNAIVVSDNDSEDEVALAKLKQGSSAENCDSDVPLYQLVEQTTPKKRKKVKDKKGDNCNGENITPKKKKKIKEEKGDENTVTPKKKKKRSKDDNGDDSSDEDIPLSKINSSTPKKYSPKKYVNSEQCKGTALKSEKKDKSLKKGFTKKGEKKKSMKLSPKKEKNLKQVTLYDLTKKGKLEHKNIVHTTPQKKSPVKADFPSKPVPTPAIVRRLLNSKRDTINDKIKYSNLLRKAISVLSPVQIKSLPEKLKEEIEHKKKFVEEKEKMAKMTPEEREAYMKDKREQAKKIQKQKMLQKLRDQRKRFEDTELTLIPLPQAKLTPTPDGFPNAFFGDVAMVTEFINCYGGLLMPDSEYPIYTDALMKALVGGSSGFAYISRVLIVLLQTLLQDEISKSYKELGTHLSDIAVSAYTSSELVRLCLSCEEDEDVDDEGEGDVPEEYVKALNDSEFYQLELEQKLCLLRGLCSRVLATYAVQDYMEEQQRKANVLTKQKNSEMKLMAAQKKSEKQNMTSDKEKVGQSEEKADETEDKYKQKAKDEKTVEQDSVTKDGNLSITSFYGKNAEDSGEDSSNWGSIVKRRRLLAAKAAAEKEKLAKEKKALREKEYQEEKQREKARKKQEQIADAINLARMVLRQELIGTDRHHDRYWVFTNTTPGLYVEKGWMGEEVNYNVQKEVPKERPEGESSSSESDDNDTENDTSKGVDQTGMTPLKIVYRTKRHVIETSVPHPGQNLWFTYRSQKDLDGLLKTLHPQGIRESLLKAEIKKRYDDISRAIIQAQRTNLELRDSDGGVEMVAGFKKELSDIELRLRNGGLGGVQDYEIWEAKLMETTDITVMGECLHQVKEGILDKFLQGFMKPTGKSNEGQVGENDEDSEEESKNEAGEEKAPDKTEKAVRLWKEAIENCQTMSRLHVLMAMLDSCIKWEKSAENAKCKICRKKCDDAKLLLCDECNQAFHMYCLRPALARLPNGDWFCPACKPRRLQVRTLEFESDEEEKEDACRECGGMDKLIICSKCPAAFHIQCHDPPLRHPPRGIWECSDCKSGANRRRRGKLCRKASGKQNYRQETASEDEEDESEAEEELQHTPTRSRSSRSQRSQELTRSRERKQHIVAQQSAGRLSRSKNSSHRDNSMAVTPTSRTSRRGPSDLSLCEDILHKVMKHKSSWPFLEPVDKKLVPDYYTLIKKPMDFQTMLKKCTRLSYASPQEFIEDAALVFENAEAYNKPDSEVFICMREVEKVFKEALHKVLPDWPYYRTVVDKEESSSGSETGRRRSRNK